MAAEAICRTLVISEILVEQSRDSLAEAHRPFDPEDGLRADGAGLHQTRHGTTLLIDHFCRRVGISHQRPVERVSAIVKVVFHAVRDILEYARAGSLRPLVIVDHLSHGRGQRACIGIEGAIVIIGGPASPRGRHHRIDQGSVFDDTPVKPGVPFEPRYLMEVTGQHGVHQ